MFFFVFLDISNNKESRTYLYVKVYVSEGRELRYTRFAKSRRNFLQARNGTSPNRDIAFRWSDRKGFDVESTKCGEREGGRE